jgi:uncharacterized protein
MPVADKNAAYVAIVIAVLGFLIGFAKGGFGGLGALLTPLLALVLPVAHAVGVLLPMLMVGDAFAVTMYWKEWDFDLVRRMFPAGVVGAVAGTFLLAWLPPDGLRTGLGLFVLLVVAYRVVSDRIQAMRYEPKRWHAPAAGLLAGFASGMFNNGVLDLALLFSLWWVILFIPLGIWVARLTLTRISPAAFEWVIIALLIFSSLWLLR